MAGKVYHAKVEGSLDDISHTVLYTGITESESLNDNNINSAADLKYLMENYHTKFPDKETFDLNTDIHVTADEWKAAYSLDESSSPNFTHNLTGNNYIISGRLINKEYNHFGFIGQSYESEITGLHITADIVNEHGADNIGGIIGLATGTTISYCSFSGSIGGEKSVSFTGGICGEIKSSGKSSSLTDNNSNSCALKGRVIGGLIGKCSDLYATIDECYSIYIPYKGE